MSRHAIQIDGHRIELSNTDKVLFPQSGITKGEIIDYYSRIAIYALPELKGRPIAMERFPNGITRQRLFQKQVPRYFPEWISRVALAKSGGSLSHVIVNDAASLVYIANQACITPHVWLSRADRPMMPDRLVIDLDPSDDDFAKVQQAGQIVKDELDGLRLPSFVQSTGSRGLHVVVPLKRSESFVQVHAFAHAIAGYLAKSNPELLTIDQRKVRRANRIFLDYYRNGYAQLIAAPYSMRAREGAPVATPIDWLEALSKGFAPTRYTIRNVFARVEHNGNAWADIDRSAVSLAQASKQLKAALGRASEL